jgi:hypothetical protein
VHTYCPHHAVDEIRTSCGARSRRDRDAVLVIGCDKILRAVRRRHYGVNTSKS